MRRHASGNLPATHEIPDNAAANGDCEALRSPPSSSRVWVSTSMLSFHCPHSQSSCQHKSRPETHRFLPSTIQILTVCSEIDFPQIHRGADCLRVSSLCLCVSAGNKRPTPPDRRRSRGVRSRRKNHHAKRNRIARRAVRQVLDRLSEHHSRSCACAHSSRPSLRQ